MSEGGVMSSSGVSSGSPPAKSKGRRVARKCGAEEEKGERRKRPEVEHYKPPGAKNGEEDPPPSAQVSSRRIAKKKKPDQAHYVPKNKGESGVNNGKGGPGGSGSVSFKKKGRKEKGPKKPNGENSIQVENGSLSPSSRPHEVFSKDETGSNKPSKNSEPRAKGRGRGGKQNNGRHHQPGEEATDPKPVGRNDRHQQRRSSPKGFPKSGRKNYKDSGDRHWESRSEENRKKDPTQSLTSTPPSNRSKTVLNSKNAHSKASTKGGNPEDQRSNESRKTSLSSPIDPSKLNQFFQEEEFTQRVSDWSLEVEMEDERLQKQQEQQQQQQFHHNPKPPQHQKQSQQHQQKHQNHHNNQHTQQFSSSKHHAGILRLPHSGVESTNWRSREERHHPQLKDDHNQHWRQSSHKVLFDPKNPNKPIPVQGNSSSVSRNSLSHTSPPSEFNGNNHYNGHAIPPVNIDVARLPQPPHVSMNYRHPFPFGITLRPNGPEWYNVFNSRIYGNGDQHDINNISLIVRSDMRLFEITMQGSWPLLSQLWDTDVAECRQNILKAFRELVKNDLVFCAEHNIEFHIWKIAFWNLTEVLKIMLQKEESVDLQNVIKGHISQLIEEGLDFYAKVLNLLNETYNLDLESYYDILKPRPTDKFKHCALVAAQNCLLCLGDLSRYQEQVNETSNFGRARQYYIKANSLETRNGRPFNMLAILSSMTKFKFEAVYYNVRCLQSKNPFSTCQQSLTVIFEDVKKKWEAIERRKMEEKEIRLRKAEREKEGSRQLIKGTRLRNEIWIKPEGGRRLHRTTSARESETIDKEDAELMEMPVVDLHRRFINTFLYLLGKLYTYIDMDSFPLALELLLKEFRILISRSPLPIDNKKLIQIMALNMFIIEHTKMKTGDTDNYRSTMQNSALQLAFEMFGILVEKCNSLFQNFFLSSESGDEVLFKDKDMSILAPIKVWCDWLLGNNDTWYPVVTEEPFNQLAVLATHLEKLKPLLRPVLSTIVNEETALHNPEGYNLIKLEEDSILCGLVPWFRGLSWSSYRRYFPVDASYSPTLAQEARRCDAINFCIEFLEGLEYPVLKWSLPDNAHISLVEDNGSSSAVEKVNAKLSNMFACHQDILEESYSDEETGLVSEPHVNDVPIPNDEIRALKHRKDTLERRRIAEERELKRVQKQILADHVSVTLEVCPRYIVPDTNCFVDHLDDIIKFTSSSQYQLRIPLVVLNELDGLAKGARPSKYSSQEHANMVSENARRALAFLKDRPPNTKCVTALGTVLTSFAITTEEDADAGKKNDDLILDVCLNLSTPKEEIKGNMRVVCRDVVLLTDDRNLKLKAHIADMPVNKLTDFIHWVSLP